MALTAYRIFIASPGGLDAERHKLREVVNHYNEVHPIPRACLSSRLDETWLLPEWQDPIELIDQIRTKCDYFVLTRDAVI